MHMGVFFIIHLNVQNNKYQHFCIRCVCTWMYTTWMCTFFLGCFPQISFQHWMFQIDIADWCKSEKGNQSNQIVRTYIHIHRTDVCIIMYECMPWHTRGTPDLDTHDMNVHTKNKFSIFIFKKLINIYMTLQLEATCSYSI